jgi:hypothetical protein
MLGIFEYLLHLKPSAYFNGTKNAATIYFIEKYIIILHCHSLSESQNKNMWFQHFISRMYVQNKE